jgi:FKBP-type peptidyl-prolyl cis-trans isomerase
MPFARRPLALLLACAALVAAGCGGDSESEATPEPAASATQTPEATPEPTKPTVAKPKGSPPKKLVKKDLRPGDGPAAQPGQTVQVQYVGVSFKTGEQFDASWDRRARRP